MARKKLLNLHKDQKDPRGKLLCPLADKTFGLDDCIVRSVDGFMCTIRLKPMDKRRIITTMDGAYRAKIAVKNVPPQKTVWWNGTEIEVHTPEYEHLMEKMLRARFRKDDAAIRALRSSRGLKLVHKLPNPTSRLSLVPAKLYCKILTDLRKEVLATGEISKYAA